MKTTKIVLVGLLAGISAGALLGVLLAPGKGSETRKKIIDKSGAFTEGLMDKFLEFVEGLIQKGDEVKQEAEKEYTKFEDVKKEVNDTSTM